MCLSFPRSARHCANNSDGVSRAPAGPAADAFPARTDSPAAAAAPPAAAQPSRVRLRTCPPCAVYASSKPEIRSPTVAPLLKRVWNHPNIGVKGGQPQVKRGSAFPFPPSATLHNRDLRRYPKVAVKRRIRRNRGNLFARAPGLRMTSRGGRRDRGAPVREPDDSGGRHQRSRCVSL